MSGGDDNAQIFPLSFPLVSLVYVTQPKVHVVSTHCHTIITTNICVKRTAGQVANTEKYTERSITASSRCTCGWSITRLLSGLDKIVVLVWVNHQAYNYPHHYMNSVSVRGTFPKTVMNNRSVERTVKVTTCTCSTMLVITYTDKNTNYKNRTSVQWSRLHTFLHVTTPLYRNIYYFSS